MRINNSSDDNGILTSYDIARIIADVKKEFPEEFSKYMEFFITVKVSESLALDTSYFKSIIERRMKEEY